MRRSGLFILREVLVPSNWFRVVDDLIPAELASGSSCDFPLRSPFSVSSKRVHTGKTVAPTRRAVDKLLIL